MANAPFQSLFSLARRRLSNPILEPTTNVFRVEGHQGSARAFPNDFLGERLNGFKRLLLVERDTVEKNRLETEKYLRTTPATTPFRSEVLSGFDQSKVHVVEAYSAYHKAELRIASAAEAPPGLQPRAAKPYSWMAISF
ncbi:hypothetical protein [Variovorax sp. YR634]|uniref:hypothetical protein n=1 Tax=Variovorax sp. YR634 TaxID=1884385 RepID=UPI00115FF3F1|nr:hypothetical protein [Variovorax sp. YR634]